MSDHGRSSLRTTGSRPDLVVGVGCQRGISHKTLQAALGQALEQVGAGLEAIVALATLETRSREQAITSLARERGWPVHAYTADALASVAVTQPSEQLRRLTGTPSVAEAAAILASGAGEGRVILEKYRYRGADGGHVTVAIAELTPLRAKGRP